MAKTIDDLSNEVTQLKDALITGSIKHEWKEKVPDPKNPKEEIEVEQKALLSSLKNHLILEAPKIMTEESAAPWIKQIGDNYEELHKELSSELFEAAGFDTIGAAVEKFHEGNAEAWKYAVNAIASLVIPAILAGIGLVLLTRFTAIQQFLQAKFFNLFKTWTGKTDHIWARNANNDGWKFQPKTEVQARANPTVTAIADIPPAAIGALREQLEKINPELLKFNNRAPAFTSAFRKLPSVSKATKAAKAVERIANAVTGIDHGQMQPVAEGVNKINNSMRNADPRKVEKVAKAVGKLKDAMVGFDATKIPKSADLGPAATKMGDLARETGTLRTKLNDLRDTIRSLDTVIA
ncbi:MULTISPECIES: hypothetical protein [unclassified Streptomyces]|uniref:hypothetical protein n=1 Tax=unclassified Streptomyces TaxID=2593676 RepID=UPI0035DC2DED